MSDPTAAVRARDAGGMMVYRQQIESRTRFSFFFFFLMETGGERTIHHNLKSSFFYSFA
jgi:hypothetical protein